MVHIYFIFSVLKIIIYLSIPPVAGREVADIEASHYGLLVAILTGLKAPKLMNSFEHILLQDGASGDRFAELFVQA